MTPEETTPIIKVEYDEGFAQLDLLDDQEPPAEKVLAILSLPCPAQRMGGGGGLGGAAMTPCGFCGEVMASTAGPHSSDGRYPKPVVITNVGDGLVFWRPFNTRMASHN